MSTYIYLIRHAQSEANAREERQGSDGPLSQEGRGEARALARYIAKTIPEHTLITSTYERAVETADIICGRTGKDKEMSDLLVEWRDPSEVIGRHFDDPKARRVMDAWMKHIKNSPRAFSDEETFTEVKERAFAFLAQMESRPEECVVAITHAKFLKLLLGLFLFDVHYYDAKQFLTIFYGVRITNTGVTLIQHYPGNKELDPWAGWRLVKWNDCAHLT